MHDVDNIGIPVISKKEAKGLGLKRYFTGRPCLRGHVAQRYVSVGTCVKCGGLATNKWFKDNPAVRLSQGRKWNTKNPERRKELNLVWRIANPEKIQASNAMQNAKPDAKPKRKAKYDANPRPAILASANRRANQKAADGKFTDADIAAINKAQRGKCAMCRKSLKGDHHVDHIMPLALGGSNWPKNLQLLCVSCNCSKRARHPIDFAQSRGLLL